MPQATAALTQRIGAPWLAPVAAVIAILLALGNLGGVGAWLAGSARLPFVAGLDGALPPAFGRIHPRWHTPHVGLLIQGAIATAFVIASLVARRSRMPISRSRRPPSFFSSFPTSICSRPTCGCAVSEPRPAR